MCGAIGRADRPRYSTHGVLNLFEAGAGDRLGAQHVPGTCTWRTAPKDDTPNRSSNRHIFCAQATCGNFQITAVPPTHSPYGRRPYILHFHNATVDLGINAIRRTSTSPTPLRNPLYAYLITICTARQILGSVRSEGGGIGIRDAGSRFRTDHPRAIP